MCRIWLSACDLRLDCRLASSFQPDAAGRVTSRLAGWSVKKGWTASCRTHGGRHV